MAKCALIAVIMVAAQLINARTIGPGIIKIGEGTKNATAYLTYDELLYIFQTRRGIGGIQPVNLTPCARAILGCCNEKQMNEYCSETLKCGAYFFDENPCEDKFILDALKAARNFYKQYE